jgi:hypothetical protein
MSSRSAPQIDQRYADPSSYHGELPPDWDGRRKATYRRDDWACQHCGTQSGPHASGEGVRLHAHHTQPRSEGGSNHLSNLVTLCEPCHQAVHDHDIFGDGWEGDDQPRTPIFGATAWGWTVSVLTSFSGLYFVYMLGLSGGLFDGVSGGSFVGALIGLYLGIVLFTVWKPFLTATGYGLLGLIIAAYVSNTGQSFTALEPLFHLVITIGVGVLLLGSFMLRSLR